MTMDEIYEALLFYDELPPERQQWIREKLDTDDDLAHAFAQWRQVCAHLRKRLEADLPECRILVLFALEEAGRDDLLTADEQQALNEARPRLEHALEAHPALEDVVARIQEEQADFETMWEEHGFDLIASDAEASDRAVAKPGSRDVRPAERTERAPRRSSAREEGRRWTRRVFIGAVVAAVVTLVFLVWPSQPTETTVQVAEGETTTIDFADGSRVRLVGAAQLSYAPEAAFDRRVTLERGRGFFEVQPDPDGRAPFVVTTPTARTTVLGTQFGVEASDESTNVVLAEGRLEVGPADPDDTMAVVLTPGQKSRVDRGGSPSAPESVDVTQALAWTGLFVFRATPTATIADKLSSHYDVPVTVDAALGDEAVTGTFERSQSVEEVLGAIATTLGADVRGTSADGFRLAPRSE
jgi:ferric-dicitrate binding protein FerR (iron transport regulator)